MLPTYYRAFAANTGAAPPKPLDAAKPTNALTNLFTGNMDTGKAFMIMGIVTIIVSVVVFRKNSVAGIPKSIILVGGGGIALLGAALHFKLFKLTGGIQY